MMSVTDRALQVLAGVVDREPRDGTAVRLVARSDGWGMEIDQPGPEDSTFEYEQRTVLVLDTGVADALQESTLDVHDTPEGLRLHLR